MAFARLRVPLDSLQIPLEAGILFPHIPDIGHNSGDYFKEFEAIV